MGTIFLRSDSDKWGQGLKWGQSESRDNMLFLRLDVLRRPAHKFVPSPLFFWHLLISSVKLKLEDGATFCGTFKNIWSLPKKLYPILIVRFNLWFEMKDYLMLLLFHPLLIGFLRLYGSTTYNWKAWRWIFQNCTYDRISNCLIKLLSKGFKDFYDRIESSGKVCTNLF